MLYAKKWHFGSLLIWLWRMFSGFILDQTLRTHLTPLVSPILTIKTQQPKSPKIPISPKETVATDVNEKDLKSKWCQQLCIFLGYLLAQSSPVSLFAVLLYTKTDEWFPGFLLFWVVTIITAGYCCKQLRSSYLADSNSIWTNAVSQCLTCKFPHHLEACLNCVQMQVSITAWWHTCIHKFSVAANNTTCASFIF